jgi:hypothetical protein
MSRDYFVHPHPMNTELTTDLTTEPDQIQLGPEPALPPSRQVSGLFVARKKPQTRTIPLTQGQVALVSEEDFEELSQFKWHAQWCSDTRSHYAVRKIRLPDGRRTQESIARRVLRLSYGDKRIADHINHDTLNNTRENLRICHTRSDSNANRRRQCNNKSGFKNVHWNKQKRRFHAHVYHNGGDHFLGYFSTAGAAAMAAATAGEQLHGTFYCEG